VNFTAPSQKPGVGLPVPQFPVTGAQNPPPWNGPWCPGQWSTFLLVFRWSCAGALQVREMRIEAANAKQQERSEHRSAHANNDGDLA
jgi:hypothetical protein